MSETVKLIIEIPKIDKELLDAGRCGEMRKEAILYAVKNGTPLDDVKAEIEEQAYLGINDPYSHGLFEALRIIDKHISGEGDKED